MPGKVLPLSRTSKFAKGRRTFAIALEAQKCVLRMDLVHLKVLAFRSAFVLMVFTDTSV